MHPASFAQSGWIYGFLRSLSSEVPAFEAGLSLLRRKRSDEAMSRIWVESGEIPKFLPMALVPGFGFPVDLFFLATRQQRQ